jgi:hypothetical protein
MTKKLENLFNLPDDTTSDQPAEVIAERVDQLREIDLAIDKIDAALPTVRDLEAADNEMDELAKLARDKFEDLMDLGMNVEARYAGAILQTAGTLLGHAIVAKQAKLDKKLRMVDLQLKKARLDQTAAKSSDAQDQPVDGKGIVLDRNALLAQILSGNKKPETE